MPSAHSTSAGPGLAALGAGILLALSAGACAGAPAARRAAAPRLRVLVVATSAVARPPPQAAIGGDDDPRDVLAREAVLVLRARGHDAGVAAEPGVASDPRAAGVDAALVVELTHLDLGALAPLGAADVTIEARLVGAGGVVAWHGRREGRSAVHGYAARSDWRWHLRAALRDALEDLP